MLTKIHQWGLRPFLFSLDPELAHKMAIATARAVGNSAQLQSIFSNLLQYQNPRLYQKVMGLEFANPLGLAAGFDKEAIATGGWSSFGFGFAEVGSITFHAQSGNPKPRLFRLPLDEAILNRMGFNNSGAAAVADQLKKYSQEHRLTIPIGINLGKSKITPLNEAKNDYLQSFRLLQELGDYFVINVSSPNTPRLRDLQAVDLLEEIITGIQAENHKPLLIKIAPDLNDADIQEIVQMSIAHGIAGLIATNTAIARDGLKTQTLPITGKPVNEEMGGISGQPLKARSTAVIKLIWQESQGKIAIVGVGGIASTADAWEKITAGASLIQIYTGWVYQGLPLIKEILAGLVQKLDESGLENISQAIGQSSLP